MRGRFGVGDVWTWTALCADTKLVPSWYVGTRDADAAYRFMSDLASRLAHRVQLTTDGHHAYLSAVDAAFDCTIDYAMLVKHYGIAPEADSVTARRSASALSVPLFAVVPIPTISTRGVSSAKISV